jgi:hypothetical protein
VDPAERADGHSQASVGYWPGLEGAPNALLVRAGRAWFLGSGRDGPVRAGRANPVHDLSFGNGSESDGGPGQPPTARFKMSYEVAHYWARGVSA